MPAIVPTITQRVRTFLAEQGAALRPWTGLQETYDELYGLLRRRRGDPAFWQPLEDLLREIIASAADSQRRGRDTGAHAELLTSWKVDELVDDLRNALRDDPTVALPARTDFVRTLPAAVLGGFLLLGLAAAGCGRSSNEERPGGTGGAPGSGGQITMMGGAGGGGGMGGAGGAGDSAATAARACSQTVATELDRAIGESTLGADQKNLLCQCFSALTTSWTTSLTDLFATATPDEISKMLSGLTQCCESDGIHTVQGSPSSSPSTQDLSLIQSGRGYRLCVAVIYKGVSFPE
jgi:hypothetical protein